MTYLLEELAAEIKNVLKFHHINEVSDKVCNFVQKALMDENFSQIKELTIPVRPKGMKIVYHLYIIFG